MKKSIRKRLEKALNTLHEPEGSTIQSIIKVINKDTPILSLRKVLEALQQGINEGLLLLNNGRFKLKNQEEDDIVEEDLWDKDEIRDECSTTSVLVLDNAVDAEEGENSSKDNHLSSKKILKGKSKLNKKPKKIINSKKKNNSGKKRTRPCFGKVRDSKNDCEAKDHSRRGHESSRQSDDLLCDSVLERSLARNERRPRHREVAEKSELRKQRGPRCTSMKKDVRMPSKVHIPYVPAMVPQRSTPFNDLLRRSPEPVNGPLFDGYNNFLFMPDRKEFFGAYC